MADVRWISNATIFAVAMQDLGAQWMGTVCALALGLLGSICPPTNAQESAMMPANEKVNFPGVSAPVDDAATSDHEHGLTFAERLKIYERSFVGPEFWIGPPLGASISQWADTPREWTRSSRGFGLRVASGYGRSAIGKTIGLGIAAIDHEQTGYVPAHEGGILRRTLHAVTGTFLSHDDYGDTMPAYSRIFGTYGAAFIANAWVPKNQANTGHALERGSTALLSGVGWNVFHEGWPDIRKVFHRSAN